MKIFPLGFFVMALFNVIEAKQSDIGQEKETNKSQLDMLIAQIRQLQEEGAHQRIQTKEQELKNEELQLQLQDQQLLLQDQRLQLQQEIKERRKETKEQRHNNNKLQEEIKELTKIKRARRADNDTDEHLKELIRAEINPLIAGLSQCEVGVSEGRKPSGKKGFAEVTQTIFFTQKFTRTPEVVTSVSAFYRSSDGSNPGGDWGPYVSPKSITTTKFDLIHQFWGKTIYYSRASWIACI